MTAYFNKPEHRENVLALAFEKHICELNGYLSIK